MYWGNGCFKLFSLKVMKYLNRVTNSHCPNFMDTKQLSNCNLDYYRASFTFSAAGPDVYRMATAYRVYRNILSANSNLPYVSLDIITTCWFGTSIFYKVIMVITAAFGTVPKYTLHSSFQAEGRVTLPHPYCGDLFWKMQWE